MGIQTKVENVYGVKYDMDSYNDRVRTESKSELIKIAEELGKIFDEDNDDIMVFLEEEVLPDDIDIIYYGNTICDTRSNPFGIILHPQNQEAEDFLKQILIKIGSNRKFGQHSEVRIS